MWAGTFSARGNPALGQQHQHQPPCPAQRCSVIPPGSTAGPTPQCDDCMQWSTVPEFRHEKGETHIWAHTSPRATDFLNLCFSAQLHRRPFPHLHLCLDARADMWTDMQTAPSEEPGHRAALWKAHQSSCLISWQLLLFVWKQNEGKGSPGGSEAHWLHAHLSDIWMCEPWWGACLSQESELLRLERSLLASSPAIRDPRLRGLSPVLLWVLRFCRPGGAPSTAPGRDGTEQTWALHDHFAVRVLTLARQVPSSACMGCWGPEHPSAWQGQLLALGTKTSTQGGPVPRSVREHSAGHWEGTAQWVPTDMACRRCFWECFLSEVPALGSAPKLSQPHLFYAYIEKSNLREKVLECDCCKKLERGVGAAWYSWVLAFWIRVY